MQILNKALIVLLAGFLISSCGSNMKYLLDDVNPSASQLTAGTYLSGTFLTSEGQTIDLALEKTLPVVLNFSSSTCGSCRDESLEFRDSLKLPRTQNPDKIHLYTLLTDTDQTQAQGWKTNLNLPWIVGVDPNGEMKKKFCPKFVIPCTVVQLPDKGIVLQHADVIMSKDIILLTGPWESGS